MTDDPDPAILARIKRAVCKLPRRQRGIFLAVRLDDMSYIEVAERTGLSVREVEQLLAKALSSLVRHVDAAPRHRWWQCW